MNNVKLQVLQLLKAFFMEDNHPKIGETDWRAVFEYAVIHNIGGMLYSVITKLPKEQQPKEDVLEKLRLHYLGTIRQSVMQDTVMQNVTQGLSEEKIKHVLMKGYILKRDYPIPELRTMGDIDFLIKAEDRLRCDEAMLQMGFECTVSGGGFVWCYQKGTVLLEIHTNVMGGNPWNGVDFEAYYADMVDRAEVDSGEYTYCFGKEDHLIYVVVHAAKHFRHAGHGVRGILDFAVFLKAHAKELDWKYVWNELEKLELDRFAKNMFALAAEWFDVDLPEGVEQLDAEFCEQIGEIIFSGGVYGYCNRNLQDTQIRQQLEESSTGNMALLKIKAMWRMVFPEYRYMRRYMKSLEKRPYLLPAAWVIRWYQAIFKRGDRNTARVKQLFAVDEGVKEEYMLLKRLGLFK